MSDWLVPVSRYVRYERESGEALTGAFHELQSAALSDDLATVVCELRGPLVDVSAGDRVWLYTNEHDTGVFGVGHTDAPVRAKTSTVAVNVDRLRTRLLAADPMPAVALRRWVPELRQGSILLDIRPRALGVIDAWEHERAERDAELLDPLGAIPWRTLSASTPDVEVLRDPVLAPIARLLRAQDFAVGAAADGASGHWLVGRRVRDVVVIDVEDVRPEEGRDEALAAIGPLREWRWRVTRGAPDLRLRTSLWIAFTARPEEQVAAFLEDEQVLVSWRSHDGVTELTDRSKQLWYQHLGVR